jgi:hypothetical protein
MNLAIFPHPLSCWIRIVPLTRTYISGDTNNLYWRVSVMMLSVSSRWLVGMIPHTNKKPTIKPN